MKKKIFLLAGIIVAVFIVFLFSEEKLEYGSEAELWKYNFDLIQYTPPREDWDGKDRDRFYKIPVTMKREGNIFNRYIFEIIFKDTETGKDIVYEGAHNVKNLFTELAVLKIRTVVSKQDDLNGLGIDPEKSPAITLGRGIDMKRIILGNRTSDNNSRFFMYNNKIYAAHAFIFERFTGLTNNHRMRQIISITDSYVERVSLYDSSSRLVGELENSQTEKNGRKMNQWKGKKTFTEQKSLNVDSVMRSLRIDLYPDETNGQGFSVAEVLTGFPKTGTWKIEMADGTRIVLDLFPPTDIKNIKYIPVKRSLGSLKESAGYILKDSVEKFRSLLQEDASPSVNSSSHK